TSNTPATDFSQAGPGTIDTDEVDPVAEADVYMAYGRDAQAEEILLEAMQKDPKRFAIHAKLLEIYANRKNVKQFEILASELYAQTGGVGTEWEKVAAMGSKLDPSNPLYSGSSPSAPASAQAPAFDPEATMVVGAGKSIDTFTLPGAHVEEPESVATPPATPQPEASPSVVEPAPLADLTSLDFDLGFGEEPAPAEAAASASELGAAEPEVGHELEQVSMPNVLDFDLDLGTATPAEVESPTAAPEPAAAMEFHLPEVEDVPAAVPAMEAPAVEENIIDFDLDLGETAQAEAPRAFDLSAINLDLEAAAPTEETVVLPELAEEPAAEIAFEPAPAAAPAVSAPADLAVGALEPEGDAQRWQEVATKLDLAKAYEEMGDMEGARELLQEVLTEGNPEQQEKARSLMEKVGS
ncbi:MAG: pilus assembly protein, partial [Betaproteobacteria bacterium]|nr:pilus assembly protein [Betaproteobacteria bacterium]